jgi:aminopeptidase C
MTNNDKTKIATLLLLVRNNTTILNSVVMDGCNKSVVETALSNLQQSVIDLQNIVKQQPPESPLV